MGASIFGEVVEAKTAQEAFNIAVRNARNEYGSRAYSGSIKEKASFSFIVIDVPEEYKDNPIAFAKHLLDSSDERVNAKYGPAGCIKMEEGRWHFFGWASS